VTAEQPDYRPGVEMAVVVSMDIPDLGAAFKVGDVMANLEIDARRAHTAASWSQLVRVDVVGALRDLADQIEAAAS
jgi:hypothetical protein